MPIAPRQERRDIPAMTRPSAFVVHAAGLNVLAIAANVDFGPQKYRPVVPLGRPVRPAVSKRNQ
jgi:hypothetical protein